MGQYLFDAANAAKIIETEVVVSKTTQPAAHTNLTPNQLEQLTKHQYLVIDDFLPSHFYAALQHEVQNIARYREAQIVSGLKPNIRSDSITWIERSNAKLAQGGLYMGTLEQLSKALNAYFFAGIRRVEAHFAHYGVGGFYKRHVDNPAGSNHRVFSCVLYLNDNWHDADGGELIIYENEQADAKQAENKAPLTTKTTFTTKTTLLPKGNRMVVFDSMLPHEVKPALRDRFSVTGWLRRDDSVLQVQKV